MNLMDERRKKRSILHTISLVTDFIQIMKTTIIALTSKFIKSINTFFLNKKIKKIPHTDTFYLVSYKESNQDFNFRAETNTGKQIQKILQFLSK